MRPFRGRVPPLACRRGHRRGGGRGSDTGRLAAYDVGGGRAPCGMGPYGGSANCPRYPGRSRSCHWSPHASRSPSQARDAPGPRPSPRSDPTPYRSRRTSATVRRSQQRRAGSAATHLGWLWSTEAVWRARNKGLAADRRLQGQSSRASDTRCYRWRLAGRERELQSRRWERSRNHLTWLSAPEWPPTHNAPRTHALDARGAEGDSGNARNANLA